MAGRERPLPDPAAGFVCPGTEFLRQATNYEEIGQCLRGERGSWGWEWEDGSEELCFYFVLNFHDSFFTSRFWT